MKTKGQHLILEFFDCDSEILDNIEEIKNIIQSAACSVNVKIVDSVFHHFFPKGVTGVLVLEESHLSIHTWPERKYASVDFYTCGNSKPQETSILIGHGLKAGYFERMLIERGELLNDKNMKVILHEKFISGLYYEVSDNIKVSQC